MSNEQPGDLSHQRYEVLRLLGRGGMASVHHVRDLDTGEQLALKRLTLPSGGAPTTQQQRARSLFEREFHTLSQLAHPRVIRVFDYGVDSDGPFYTMELLDGGDLHSRAPVPWQAACALMRDVCSVLSLLHSRQMLHRDLSPRNVRCTETGFAKLIDFGAMSPMGWTREVVGTPPVCAPEVLNQQELDARSDLYALGCSLYYALVGRHGYPARDFGQLPLLWGELPPPPSTLVDGIPDDVDALVASLMHLDPAARPRSAAEVMARLTAVAGLEADEQLPVPHAYLVSPRLVGREALLERARKKVELLVQQGRGGAMLLLGDPGLGRSRMVDAVLLEARFRGATTVRADAADARNGEAGIVRSIARQLLTAHPNLARQAAEPYAEVLEELIPGLRASATDEASREVPEEPTARSVLQQALRGWFCAVAQGAPLVVGVDDLESADAFSEACLALLAHEAAEHPLTILVAADSAHFRGQRRGPRAVLKEASSLLGLEPLNAAETAALLRSIFGEAHHVPELASTLHEIAAGVPRDLMELLRHLVERGVVRYEAGAWSVPGEVDPADVPASLAIALERKASALNPDSLSLARALALAPSLRLEPVQMLWLTAHRDLSRLIESLDQLLLCGVLRSVGHAFELSQRGWVAVLLAGTGPDERHAALLRIAEVYRRLSDPFRTARYLLEAGEVQHGLDTLVEFSSASLAETVDDPGAYMKLLRSLPSDWALTFERAFELCRTHRRSAQDLFVLHARGAGIAAGRSGEPGAVRGLLQQLVTAIGLDLYERLDEPVEPAARLLRAMNLASARTASLPEAERLATPKDALPAMTRAYLEAIACAVSRLDLSLLDDLPSIEPLRSVSPLWAIAQPLAEGVRCRLTSRSHRTRAIYEELLRRLAESDCAGLDRPHHENTINQVRVGLGLLEGSLGSVRALALAQELAENSVNEVNALSIRMLFHLWQGDARKAESCRERAELLRIAGGDSALFIRRNLAAELPAFAAMGDLAQLREAMPTVSRMAAEVATWKAIAHYARGEYERIRGAWPRALDELARASQLARAGDQPLYCEIQAAQVRALAAAGEVQAALNHGHRCLEEAEATDLDHTRHLLELETSQALARLGRFDAARAMADAAADGLVGVRAGKLLCGAAEEASARIAILEGDRASFEEHASECEELYKAHGNRALHAKHAQLLEDATRAGVRAATRRPSQAGTGEDFSVAMSTVLSSCATPGDHARRALETMCKQTGAAGGSLFLLERGRPLLVAEVGAVPDASTLERWAVARLCMDQQPPDDVTLQSALRPSEPPSVPPFPRSAFGRLHDTVISHLEDGRPRTTGIAVFSFPQGGLFRAPVDTATQLSRHWYETGESDGVPPLSP